MTKEQFLREKKGYRGDCWFLDERKLIKDIKEEGKIDCPYWHYGIDLDNNTCFIETDDDVTYINEKDIPLILKYLKIARKDLDEAEQHED